MKKKSIEKIIFLKKKYLKIIGENLLNHFQKSLLKILMLVSVIILIQKKMLSGVFIIKNLEVVKKLYLWLEEKFLMFSLI